VTKTEELLLNVGMLEEFEGFEGLPYECPAGFQTIGFGRNLEVYPYTETEAREWSLKILEDYRKSMMIHHPWLVEAPMEVRLIVTDMAYNLGVQGVNGFKNMFKALKHQEYLLAADELKDSKYYEQTGHRAEVHFGTLKALGGER